MVNSMATVRAPKASESEANAVARAKSWGIVETLYFAYVTGDDARFTLKAPKVPSF